MSHVSEYAFYEFFGILFRLSLASDSSKILEAPSPLTDDAPPPNKGKLCRGASIALMLKIATQVATIESV